MQQNILLQRIYLPALSAHQAPVLAQLEMHFPGQARGHTKPEA